VALDFNRFLAQQSGDYRVKASAGIRRAILG
jgi:hypothetical protein